MNMVYFATIGTEACPLATSQYGALIDSNASANMAEPYVSARSKVDCQP